MLLALGVGQDDVAIRFVVRHRSWLDTTAEIHADHGADRRRRWRWRRAPVVGSVVGAVGATPRPVIARTGAEPYPSSRSPNAVGRFITAPAPAEMATFPGSIGSP